MERRPLQNRVTPSGEIVAAEARGLFMGNRGGRLHDPETKLLTGRRWISRRWICCVTDFKNRKRQVMGYGYTELFFLDEVTALAAGHRPCFECRRSAALQFGRAWANAQGTHRPPNADTMDKRLHGDRTEGRGKRTFNADLASLPDGVIILHDGEPKALKDGRLLPWSLAGYGPALDIRKGAEVTVLTPKIICSVLAAGYRPAWHASIAPGSSPV